MSAAQAATSLAGEFLSSHTEATITGGTCNPSGDTTYTFTASGVSSDPYPGTFTESGSVTIGAQTDEFVAGQFRGPIRAFSANFTITSSSGTVHGTYGLAGEVAPDSGNAGTCFSGGNEGVQVLTSNLTYAATITDPSGSSFTDVGTGASDFNAGDDTPDQCEQRLSQLVADIDERRRSDRAARPARPARPTGPNGCNGCDRSNR